MPVEIFSHSLSTRFGFGQVRLFVFVVGTGFEYSERFFFIAGVNWIFEKSKFTLVSDSHIGGSNTHRHLYDDEDTIQGRKVVRQLSRKIKRFVDAINKPTGYMAIYIMTTLIAGG